MRTRGLLLLLGALAGAWWPRGAACVQAVSGVGPGEPAEFAAALSKLEAGDTIGALAELRSLTKARPDFGPAFLRLGALLSARAGEASANYLERVEAEKALARATQLMPNDPMALLEYGLLLKRQSMKTDAKRVLERAWAAAERTASGLAARDRARLQFELGKVYEAWWEDWQNLVQIPPTAQGLLHCSAATAAGGGEGELPLLSHPMVAVVCPRQWAEQAEHVVPLEDLKSEERARMVEHFRLALAADPGHVEAAIHLLGHLADAGEWGEYERVADGLVAAAPEDARAHLFRGLGLHETGRDEAADSAFRRALGLMEPRERAVFDDITLLLPRRLHERYAALDGAGREATARLFFTSTDPLFLTGSEERRLEHYARLAWVELKYGDPERGLRGWETEPGQIWVRYGRPWKWYQCCYGGSGTAAGGWTGDNHRYVYWSYGPDGPVFVFRRQLTYRHAVLLDPAKQLADELAARSPELYRPRTVTSVHGVPHQLVRFRGSRPELTLVEIHAQPPLDSLGATPGSRLDAGIFLFGPEYEPLWSRRHAVEVGDRPVMLTYRAEVGPGRYRYAIEARVAGPDSVARPAARVREVVEAPGFAGGGVALSDLLLADALVPLVDAPSSRAELRIVPSRTLAFEQGAPVHLYFEVYGLQPDEDGYGSYRAELAVEDSTRRNLVQRIARGARELFRRGAGDQRVSWERTAPVRDGVVMDFLTVDLPALEAGEYVMRVRVREAGSGAAAEAVRRFRVVAPQPPDGGG
ncbi:MAG TPA: GWxTD domain-containing protein [Longimicrobiales bacterium]